MTAKTYQRLAERRAVLACRMRDAVEGSALRLSLVRQLGDVYRAMQRAQQGRSRPD